MASSTRSNGDMLKVLRTKSVSKMVKDLLGLDGNTVYTWGEIDSLLQRQQRSHLFSTNQQTVYHVLQELSINYRTYEIHKARLQ